MRVLLWSVAARSLQPLLYDKNQIILGQIKKKKVVSYLRNDMKCRPPVSSVNFMGNYFCRYEVHSVIFVLLIV